MTKIPKFFLKLIDAFIMRIPASLVVLFTALAVSGIEDANIDQRLMAKYPVLWFAVLAFAAGWAFFYTVFGRTRSRGMNVLIVIAEIILTAAVSSGVFSAIGKLQNIIPYLLSMDMPQILILSWLAYMIVSEIFKAKARKKRRRPKSDGGNAAFQTFAQLTDASLALSAMGRCAMAESSDHGGYPSSGKARNVPAASPKANSAAGEVKGSGAASEGALNNLLRNRGYEIYKLRNGIVLIIANAKVYILRYLKDPGVYTVEEGKWYKGGKYYADIYGEIAFVERRLREKCGVRWTKALVVKTFEGGNVPGSKELKYADVSKNYNAVEAAILKHIPLNHAEKKSVSATFERIKVFFKDRFVSEGGDK